MIKRNIISSFSITLVLIVSSLWSVSLFSQSTIKGKVDYSAITKKNKLKRGSNYRNRGQQKKESQSDDNNKSKSSHSIISLTPLDTEVVLTSSEAVLRQKEKTFEPHVLAITKGSSVTFTNEDNFYHNVFSLTKGSRFNLGRKKPGKSVKKTFNKPGLIKVFCDIHPQMNAYIICLETPFFSTVDDEGNYEIKNLPDGKYKLQFLSKMFQYSLIIRCLKQIC